MACSLTYLSLLGKLNSRVSTPANSIAMIQEAGLQWAFNGLNMGSQGLQTTGPGAGL